MLARSNMTATKALGVGCSPGVSEITQSTVALKTHIHGISNVLFQTFSLRSTCAKVN